MITRTPMYRSVHDLNRILNYQYHNVLQIYSNLSYLWICD